MTMRYRPALVLDATAIVGAALAKAPLLDETSPDPRLGWERALP
jgi:hypothetical protein